MAGEASERWAGPWCGDARRAAVRRGRSGPDRRRRQLGRGSPSRAPCRRRGRRRRVCRRTGSRGYTFNEIGNGVRICELDAVQSQANRMEASFRGGLAGFVPRHAVEAGGHRADLTELPHRIADAAVRTTELAGELWKCFEAFAAGDAVPMARLAPTSLVYGAWDSRDTRDSVPRSHWFAHRGRRRRRVHALGAVHGGVRAGRARAEQPGVAAGVGGGLRAVARDGAAGRDPGAGRDCAVGNGHARSSRAGIPASSTSRPQLTQNMPGLLDPTDLDAP